MVKNEKRYSKYIIGSDKLYKNNSISPKYYRRYLCSTHNYKNEHIINMNTISFPKEIYIDLLNIPKNIDINNNFLSKYYSKFFHSNNYNYKHFSSFIKKSLEDNSIIKNIKNIEHLIVL